MSKTVNAFDADGMNAPEEIRRLCVKVANQAGKGLWWNAMAVATELVAACQHGCRAEVERVTKKRGRESRRSKAASAAAAPAAAERGGRARARARARAI